MPDKRFGTVNCCRWSFWYLDQSLLTGLHGKSTVTVVNHAFIWNQSTKQHVQRLADCLLGWGQTRSQEKYCNVILTWQPNNRFWRSLLEIKLNISKKTCHRRPIMFISSWFEITLYSFRKK